MRRIAIVGGGISGIAAALTLARQPGIRVSLLEASNRLGGVLETLREGDYLVERSADNFATLIPDALELSVQCGLADDFLPPNREGRQAFVFLDGRIHPIPAGFSLMQPTRLMPMLTTSTLSWRGKLRLLREIWIPPRDSHEDESLESFAVRRLGREAFEKLVDPIVSGIFTADPTTLSMEATMPQFLDMERTHGGLIRGALASRRQDAAAAARRASGARYDSFLAPRNGMSDWIDGLTQHLPEGSVQHHTRATKLVRHRNANGRTTWELALEGTDCQHRVQSFSQFFDAVVLATPAATTSRLLSDVAPEASRIVGDISYASSAIVAMVVNRCDLASRIDGFGLVVPRREHRPTLAISFASNKYSGRVPDDQILLRFFFGGAREPEWVDRTDSELIELAYSEAKTILKWNKSLANWQTILRWKDSMPQYRIGHPARMEKLDQLLATCPTLQLCGAAYRGVGIPQCIRSGKLAAEQVLRSLQSDYSSDASDSASGDDDAPSRMA